MATRIRKIAEPSAPPDGVLFQERLRADPFWMLVACSLVNLTTWKCARPVFDELVRRYPSHADMARAKPEDLHDLLKPLGLWRRRAISLTRLANEWADGKRPLDSKGVKKLSGCGRYASDSWAIFIDGRTDVEVTDGKLSWYLGIKNGAPT